jgi:cytochrome P450
MTVPVDDDVQLADLWSDPYPIYQRLREHSPVHWVPGANRYLITRQADVISSERNTAFSNKETPTLVYRTMGEVIMRKEGAEHVRERAALEAPLKPRAIKEQWLPRFQNNARTLIDSFVERGSADLFTDFASGLAARNMATFLGLRCVTPKKLIEWCQAIIDGSGNYADDPDIWARCDRANAEIDEALEESMAILREAPDHSVISSMMHADDPLTTAQIRGNVKVVIGGGLNEPRDALLVSTYGLLTHPAQKDAVLADPGLWPKVFEEAVRWVAPIGMYPRQVTQEVEVAGVTLQPGDHVGLVVASANRDAAVYENPDEFDIHRGVSHHVAFGAGPHFCAGAWVARASVARAALPQLFGRLRNLRLDESIPVRWGGWVFRGPLNMPVCWDA